MEWPSEYHQSLSRIEIENSKYIVKYVIEVGCGLFVHTFDCATKCCLFVHNPRISVDPDVTASLNIGLYTVGRIDFSFATGFDTYFGTRGNQLCSLDNSACSD